VKTAARVERILVVDDDEAGRYLKTHTLRRHGYTVAEAALGKDALRMVEADPPHLVLLDVKLPDISGLEVCRRIKTAHPSVAILQTSAALLAPRIGRRRFRAALIHISSSRSKRRSLLP
jgi:CheY-like chemotaxis protein